MATTSTRSTPTGRPRSFGQIGRIVRIQRQNAGTARARGTTPPGHVTAASRFCVAAAVATLLWLGLAQATPIDAAGKCRLVVPAKIQTGTPYDIRGTGFAANRAIAVSLTGGGTKLNVSIQSDAKGGFSLRLAAAYGEQGTYSVSAQGGKGKARCVAKATYTVTLGPSPTPTPTLPPLPAPATSAGDLPTKAIVAVAAFLVAVLVVAVLGRLARRRRSAA
jgi:hypothetical protein